jgi:DNA-binding NarL/FixJ family response regulator
MTPIRIAIADEFLLVAEGIEALLSRESDLEVKGCGTEGEAFLRLLKRRPADVAIVGRRLSDRCGLDVIATILELERPPRIVLLATELTPADTVEAFRLGVAGILVKSMPAKMLRQCVRAVHAGKYWIEKDATRRALERLIQMEASKGNHARIFSARELDVLRMVARGMRNREVAAKLFISEATVKVHLSRIFRKLNIRSRVELSLYARQENLI